MTPASRSTLSKGEGERRCHPTIAFLDITIIENDHGRVQIFEPNGTYVTELWIDRHLTGLCPGTTCVL